MWFDRSSVRLRNGAAIGDRYESAIFMNISVAGDEILTQNCHGARQRTSLEVIWTDRIPLGIKIDVEVLRCPPEDTFE